MNKRALVIFVFCFLFLSSSLPQIKDLSYSYQHLLTWDGAEKGDDVGKFYSCFTYDTVSAITFKKTAGNAAFAIEYETGMIYIDDPLLLSLGKDTLGIEVCDGDNCGVYFAVINIIDSQKCVFIDPTAAPNGNGSFEKPFDSWTDVHVGTLKARYAYLQKRGTLEKTTVINGNLIGFGNSSGTPEGHISIGAYGKGDQPVLINGSAKDPAITFGYFRSGGSKYVDVYELEVRDCEGILVEYSGYNAHLMFTNITVTNCTNNANIYLKEPYPNDFYDMDLSLCNIKSFNPGTSHCIKTNRDVDITNALVYGAPRHGVSFHDKCTLRYVHAHHNNGSGLEFQGDSSLIVKCISSHNAVDGVLFDEDTWDHNTLDSSWVYENADDGVDLRGNDYAVITNNYIYGNKGIIFDNGFGDGISIRTYSDSVVITGNKIYDNNPSGIHVYSDAGDGLSGVFIHNNVFYGNRNSLLIEAGDSVFFYRNTSFREGIIADTTGYFEARNNILGAIEGKWIVSHNLVTDTDTIYKDPRNQDFTLKGTAVDAIDKGVDVGVKHDFEGKPLSLDKAPDIGAYEFDKKSKLK